MDSSIETKEAEFMLSPQAYLKLQISNSHEGAKDKWFKDSHSNENF